MAHNRTTARTIFLLVIGAGLTLLVTRQNLSCRTKVKDPESDAEVIDVHAKEPYKLSPEFEAIGDYWRDNNDPGMTEVLRTLDKATRFYRALQVNDSKECGWNTPGGYVWAYSRDLTMRAGRKGICDPREAVIEAPGTPVVGKAFLHAFRATGNMEYLAAAEEAGKALMIGQLRSGGFPKRIIYDPKEKSARDRYLEAVQAQKLWRSGTNNIVMNDGTRYSPNYDRTSRMLRSSFKEETMQLALDFLIELAHVTGKTKFHRAAKKGLQFMMKAQHQVGAWSDRYPLEEREGHLPDDIVSNRYSFDDDATNSSVALMLKAYRVFGDTKYLRSAEKGAGFILESQVRRWGGWSLYYDYALQPAWGRGNPNRKSGGIGEAVEPPAMHPFATGKIARTLMFLYLETGDKRYLQSAAKAIEWLRNCTVAENTWAEFYEIETGRPIFIEKGTHKILYGEGESTSKRPGKYAFHQPVPDAQYIVNPRLYISTNTIRITHNIALLDHLIHKPRASVLREIEQPSLETIANRRRYLAELVEEIMRTQERDGRWYDHGQERRGVAGDNSEVKWGRKGAGGITSRVFCSNVNVLSEFLTMSRLEDLQRQRSSAPAAKN